MDFLKLTINNFIGDLPKIFNANFKRIKELFDSFIQVEMSTPDTPVQSVTLKGNDYVLNGDFSSVKANTVKANNIVIVDGNRTYTLKEYIRQCIAEVAAENETNA